MGELPNSGFFVGRLGDSFPDLLKPYQPSTDTENEVLYLLEVGRSNGNTYDLKNSPLTTFVVKYIGFDGIRQMKERSQELFQGIISSEDFLASCNTDMTKIIINEVIKLLENRQVALRHPWQQLPHHFATRSNIE